MKNKTTNPLQYKADLAKAVCIYNGQRGTDKQIVRTLKCFSHSTQMLEQFASGRINLNNI